MRSQRQSSDVLQREAIQRRQAAQHHVHRSTGSHVFDDPNDEAGGPGSGTSGSLLGSSVIRHNIKCKCGEHVPMWYARCPACGRIWNIDAGKELAGECPRKLAAVICGASAACSAPRHCMHSVNISGMDQRRPILLQFAAFFGCRLRRMFCG